MYIYSAEQKCLSPKPFQVYPACSDKFFCAALEPCWKQEHLKQQHGQFLTVLSRQITQIHTFVQLIQHPVPDKTQRLQLFRRGFGMEDR